MAETLRSDGKAVDVTVLSTVTKGDVVLADGFAGIAMQDAVSGEEIAIEIATREHEINVGSVAAAKGDVLYLTSGGALTATVGSNKPFCKVTVAKDSNNIVWAVLLPQS
jgi:predicted RecA/RadA family phage recombinase